MRKRWRLLVACLLAGVVLNVLVAMACARWGSELNPPFEQAIHDTLVEAESLPPEAAAFISDEAFLKLLPDAKATRLKKTWWASWFVTRTMYSRFVQGIGWHGEGQPGGARYAARVYGIHAFGFPLRSMCYVHQEGMDALFNGSEREARIPGWRGGWPLEPTGDIRSSIFTTTTVVAPERPLGVSRIVYPGSVVYPLVPMPLGFAINSLLYAALAFALCTLPGTARRWLRSWRHQCESCGYPRPIGDAVARGASLVCSECGEAHA